jgi:hypothetical protein
MLIAIAAKYRSLIGLEAQRHNFELKKELPSEGLYYKLMSPENMFRSFA